MDTEVLEALRLLRENYITLPPAARDAGLKLAKAAQEATRQEYLAISDIIKEIESITENAN